MALTIETQEKVAKIITQQAISLRESEIQKEVLTQDRTFVALNVFQRLDTLRKMQLTSLDLVNFFRDNKLVVSEADCYMLVKQYDSNNDGFLSLHDVMLILCPRNYTHTKNLVATAKHVNYAKKVAGLNYQMELAVVQVLQKQVQNFLTGCSEIEAMKKVEPLKQDLCGQFDYSILSIFRAIDQFSHGKVTADNLRVYLRNFECAQILTEEDIQSWIKQFDTNVSGGLGFSEIVSAMQCMTNYQRTDKFQPSKAQFSEIENIEAQNESINQPESSKPTLQKSRIAIKKKGSLVGINKVDNSDYKSNGSISKTTGFTTQIGGNMMAHHDGDLTTAGDILNFPTSYEQASAQEVNFSNQLVRMSQSKTNQASQLYPSTSSIGTFAQARDFAAALIEMCVLEGQMEKKRRDLALRPDFNMADCYMMFSNLGASKQGITSDDLFKCVKNNLEMTITQDESFIIFCKVDKDSDGIWSFEEICESFCPREEQYEKLVRDRGGFYGKESDGKAYFEPETREMIRRFIRGFVEVEISIELIRQKIINKMVVKTETAFKHMDTDRKGYIIADDIKAFLRGQNMYPIEKNLKLLFERFDKEKHGVVTQEDFATAIKPFLTGVNAAE